MAETIRFPLLSALKGLPAERSLIIDLIVAQPGFLRGGDPIYKPLTPWKINANGTEVPFPCIVVEFKGNAAFTIGDGATPIGLYGQINDTGTELKTLLGILGVNIAGTNVPVIPLDVKLDGDLVGYSQIVANVGCYDALSIGGVGADINFGGGNLVTVSVRPIIRRTWAG